ncbi:hypothetical protein [Sorangium sp. So ce887]|uniref:hypothetical protein n=1 Tax=Sorangium sp. So ce887 TaxID=3133324 RepID=UPI003F624C35
MITALVLLAVQGALGAFDTLYYHEWRARLPGGVPGTAPELVLHGTRDLVYAVLFASLPFVRWEGLAAWLLAALLLVEIVITLRDFVVEDTVRGPLGGVYPGERVMHAVMGIVYGAALAHLLPELRRWSLGATGFSRWEAPLALRVILPLMAAGVLLSGLRDLGAVYGPRWLRFPWGRA